MGNRGSHETESVDVVDADAAEEAAILADGSLTDGEKAARMHVLEPKDRGRNWEDFFETGEDSLLGKGAAAGVHNGTKEASVSPSPPTRFRPFAPAGHYGEVRKVTRIADGAFFAMKTIEKRRPIYIEILKSEVKILSVSLSPPRRMLPAPQHRCRQLRATSPRRLRSDLAAPLPPGAQNTDHPGIVKMVDKFELGKYLYLVRQGSGGAVQMRLRWWLWEDATACTLAAICVRRCSRPATAASSSSPSPTAPRPCRSAKVPVS